MGAHLLIALEAAGPLLAGLVEPCPDADLPVLVEMPVRHHVVVLHHIEPWTLGTTLAGLESGFSGVRTIMNFYSQR